MSWVTIYSLNARKQIRDIADRQIRYAIDDLTNMDINEETPRGSQCWAVVLLRYVIYDPPLQIVIKAIESDCHFEVYGCL